MADHAVCHRDIGRLLAEIGRLRHLVASAREELHHKHGPDDGDTCYACFLEGEIDKVLVYDVQHIDGNVCE